MLRLLKNEKKPSNFQIEKKKKEKTTKFEVNYSFKDKLFDRIKKLVFMVGLKFLLFLFGKIVPNQVGI